MSKENQRLLHRTDEPRMSEIRLHAMIDRTLLKRLAALLRGQDTSSMTCLNDSLNKRGESK